MRQMNIAITNNLQKNKKKPGAASSLLVHSCCLWKNTVAQIWASQTT